MGYVINISKNGTHLFATAERSIQSKADLKTVFLELDQKGFNESGYEMTVMRWTKSGVEVSVKEIFKK